MEYSIVVRIEDNGKIKIVNNENINDEDMHKLYNYFNQSYHANKLIEECKKDVIETSFNSTVSNILKNSEIEKIRLDERIKLGDELILEKWKREEAENKLKLLAINDTIMEKGIQGELFVEDYIYKHIKLNNEWSISNISKDGNHNSDLELKYKSTHCVIEVKNIKAKLSESNIKKFREIYINSKEKNYNSGIFISLLSEFGPSSGVYDFCIQENNNKYMIYISKVKENPDKIIFAMEIINQIIVMSKNSSEEKKNQIIDMLNKQVRNYSNLYSEANKAIQSVKTMKTNIKQYRDEIIEFLQSATDNNIE